MSKTSLRSMTTEATLDQTAPASELSTNSSSSRCLRSAEDSPGLFFLAACRFLNDRIVFFGFVLVSLTFRNTIVEQTKTLSWPKAQLRLGLDSVFVFSSLKETDRTADFSSLGPDFRNAVVERIFQLVGQDLQFRNQTT